MTNKKWETAIGAVIYNDTLTIAIRHGNQLEPPTQHKIRDAAEAAEILLAQKELHKHDDAMVFLASSAMAALALEAIRKRDERSRDQLVDGLAEPLSVTGTGAQFYNRHAELHRKFRDRVRRGELKVTSLEYAETADFGPDDEEKGGKIYYLPVDEVKRKLDRYPAFAIAAVLAAQDVPFRSAAPRHQHDPLGSARTRVGHDPYRGRDA